MINLLPEENQKEIKTEYKTRVLIVAGVLLFLVLMIGVVLLLPIFYTLHSQKTALTEQLVTVEKQASESVHNPAISLIDEVNAKITVLQNNNKGGGAITVPVVKILEHKPKNISLDGFEFNGKKMIISGISPTREDLVAFVELLQKDEFFGKIDSPISNLLKGKNFEFKIEMELK